MGMLAPGPDEGEVAGDFRGSAGQELGRHGLQEIEVMLSEFSVTAFR